MSPVPSLHESFIPLPPGIPDVTVLIADTDPQITHRIKRPLEDGGYSVLVARSGHQALQTVYNRQPDVVLLGSHLHETNGRLICQQIKSDRGLGFLPVIMLAESARDFDSVTGNGNGGTDLSPDAVLIKPVELSELATWLQSMLKLKAQYDRKLDRLAREMRRLEMLRSEIISNISHELGTPLLQVKSAISLLSEIGLVGDAPEQRRLTDMATQAITRLEQEVSNIKQLARTHDVRLEPVAVHDAAQRAIFYLGRGGASRANVHRVDVQLDSDLPFVLADTQGLARLLQVLIDNALKFSLPHERVLVCAECLDDRRVWIGVQDAGIGIPEEEHERIFGPFYKVDRSTTQQHGGSGTGLALAALLASGMNITIDVESEPGVGSVFSLIVPVVDWTNGDDRY